MSQLRIENLRYHHCGPINLTVPASQCVCIAGPSGAGKTLMLRSLADLDPHQGSVFLEKRECAATAAYEWRRQVALLPAESHWWHDRVGEHFNLTEETWLPLLGFDTKVMAWEISRLSTGERQRLALLRMLCNKPQVLLLDEPTASLDETNIQKVEDLIGDYRRSTGAAVIWVSHNESQIKRVSEEYYILHNGALIKQ